MALLCLASAVNSHEVAITEVMYNPPDAKPEFVELLNLTSNRLDMAKWTLSGGASYTFPAFNPASTAAHFLKEYERIVLSSATEAATRAAYPGIPLAVRVFGPWTGLLDNNGDTITLTDAAGAQVVALHYGDRGHWSRAADGAGHALEVINKDRPIDDWRNWRVGNLRLGTPGTVEPTLAEEPTAGPEVGVGATTTVTEFNGTTVTNLVPLPANPGDTRWRYWNGTSAPQADWRTVPDASLPALAVPANAALPGWGPADPATQGFAPLGHETTIGVAFPGIRTEVAQTSGLLTYYYRTTFNWSGPLNGASFVIEHYLDDGGIYYLNGQEIGRLRMPNPSGHANTADPTAAPDETFEPAGVTGSVPILEGKLLGGANVLSLELHQNNGTSSDHVSAPRLKISTLTPAGVQINEIKPGAAGNGFVEFYNPTAAPVDLQNWYLSDTPGNLTKYQITASVVVPPLGFTTVGYSESSLGLSTPVVVILTQPDGTTRQAYINSAMPVDGRSLGRKPAGWAYWYLFTGPTPGAENFSSPAGGQSPVRLNETHFGSNGRVDWVELYNAGTTAVSGAALYVEIGRASCRERVLQVV